jgi:hypothetical protein
MSVYPYVMPIDKYGRKWPEFALPNHKVWLCGSCGQPEVNGNCSHKRLKAATVKKLGGKL